MKIAPFVWAIDNYNKSCFDLDLPFIQHIIVHTGQHYDNRMSDSFFQSLGIPKPDINLNIGSGSHAEQVGNTMIAFEKVIEQKKPNWVVVLGDVNATIACSITAKKQHIKVCHIEAGLRSGDLKMPEEINRVVTDRLSDLLLAPDHNSCENLIKEGVAKEKIKFVGNIMIDTLEANRLKASKLKVIEIFRKNKLVNESGTVYNKPEVNNFAILTIHRPSNVDNKSILTPIINLLCGEIAKDMPIIWPIHPRTQNRLKEFGLWEKVIDNDNLILLHPIGYQEMMRLTMDAKIMFTDSGGLQEECTVLGTSCLTLRWNTERPITLRQHGGAAILVGNNTEQIRKEYYHNRKMKRKFVRPELWDGKTAERCLQAILNYID